jgi:hypothetical protein
MDPTVVRYHALQWVAHNRDRKHILKNRFSGQSTDVMRRAMLPGSHGFAVPTVYAVWQRGQNNIPKANMRFIGFLN